MKVLVLLIRAFLLLSFSCSIFDGCRPAVDGNSAEVVIRIRNGNLDSVRIFRIGLLDSTQTFIGNTVLCSPRDSYVMRLPRSKEILYQVLFQYSGLSNFFIADVSRLSVTLDSKTREWAPTGSVITDSIQALVTLAGRSASIIERLERLIYNGTARQLNSKAHFSDSISLVEQRFRTEVRTFCRTTTNPTAFLVAYQFLQHEIPDIVDMLLIREAVRRFTASVPIKRLEEELKDITAIYAQELQIGDRLPAFICQDLSGSMVSLAAFRGRYVLLDFWASYSSSKRFHEKELRLLKQMNSRKLVLTGIALDNDVAACKRLVKAGPFLWNQWIDTSMWHGRVVKALKFDSIPFNLLISPEQRVLEKAIPTDSLQGVLRRFELLGKPSLRHY